MSGAGRTTWWPRDAATHDRERIIELGDEFGPLGPYTLTVLCDLAQQQGGATGNGHVKTGWKVLSRKCHGTIEDVQAVVLAAVEYGALDDFEALSLSGGTCPLVSESRMFTCRVSGWASDTKRGKAAVKKSEQRAKQANTADVSPSEGTRPQMSPTRPDQTGTSSLRSEVHTPGAEESKPVKWRGRVVRRETLQDAEAVLGRFNAKAGTSYRPLTGAGKPSQPLSRILGAFAEDDRIDRHVAEDMIDVAFTAPFWDRTPDPGVVFGPGVRDRNLERVLNPGTAPATPRGKGTAETDAYLQGLREQHALALAAEQAQEAEEANAA